MILLGLFSAFCRRVASKWGYFSMAIIAYLAILYQLVLPARRAILARDTATAKVYVPLGIFAFILWTLYPIFWALGDGAGKWSVDVGIIAFAVLDILAVPVFGFWLILTHATRDVAAVDGFWSHGLTSEGTIRIEDARP
jgi:bacteriorhodopsin